MLELILGNRAPYAILVRDVDAILCAGALVAEIFFHDELRGIAAAAAAGGDGDGDGDGKTGVPIIAALGAEDFAKLDGLGTLSIVKRNGDEGNFCIIGGGENGDDVVTIYANDLLRLESTLLPDASSSSSSSSSPAEVMALRTIGRIASIQGATELIPVASAHIDAVTYIGPGGLRFANRLVELGGRVKVA
jgi:hypothetical protein